ncbi:hypothetical protein V6B16_03340 [Salinimicrobium catena]|uniref:hypothetical protein n=1 Tax=Salinimicrobium catena TaxID=390640 RepID=UPI002FE4F6C6
MFLVTDYLQNTSTLSFKIDQGDPVRQRQNIFSVKGETTFSVEEEKGKFINDWRHRGIKPDPFMGEGLDISASKKAVEELQFYI